MDDQARLKLAELQALVGIGQARIELAEVHAEGRGRAKLKLAEVAPGR